MKLLLWNPPQMAFEPTKELLEIPGMIDENLWKLVCGEYKSKLVEQASTDKGISVGKQRMLNSILAHRLADASWEGSHGVYRKNDT